MNRSLERCVRIRRTDGTLATRNYVRAVSGSWTSRGVHGPALGTSGQPRPRGMAPDCGVRDGCSDGIRVYASQWDGEPRKIYITDPASVESREVGFPGMTLQSISPTRELLLMNSGGTSNIGGGRLMRVPLNGSAPTQVDEGIRSAEWSHDGKSFAVIRAVSAGQGVVRNVRMAERTAVPGGVSRFGVPGASGTPRRCGPRADIGRRQIEHGAIGRRLGRDQWIGVESANTGNLGLGGAGGGPEVSMGSVARRPMAGDSVCAGIADPARYRTRRTPAAGP